MNRRLIEQGAGHHHPEVGPNGVDSEKLSPRDFYWWSIEQGGGRLEDAVSSIGSSEDAIKFAVGMRQENVATAQRNHCRNTAEAIGSKIEEALGSDIQPEDEETSERARKNDIWRSALNEFYGTTAEISQFSESIVGELDKTIEEISGARTYLEKLAGKVSEQTYELFSLDSGRVVDLNLIADGYTAQEHAEELGKNDAEDSTTAREASMRRNAVRSKLKAKSMPHSVRLGIEYGLIDYDTPADDNPTVEIGETDKDILELYSRGLYSSDIAERKDTTTTIIDSRLSQMVKDFSAKNKQNLVKRAFEEGVLRPDEQTVLHHLQGSLRYILQAEEKLISARAYLVDSGDIEEAYEAQPPERMNSEEENISPASTASQYPTSRYVLGEQAKEAGKITDDIFALLGETYESLSPVLHPLSPIEQEEAEITSEGVKVSERTTDGTTRLAITALRLSMLKKLGTKSMANAMRIMIEGGILPAEWTHPDEQVEISDPLIVAMLEFASYGGSDPDDFDSTERIAEHFGYTPRGIIRLARQAKDDLSAEDWASLTRRGFEEGILIADGRLGDLQNAQQRTSRAAKDISAAVNILSELDANELIHYLFPQESDGLSDIERRELQRMVEGIVSKVSSSKDDVTPTAIDTRRAKAKNKLGARTLTEAVAIAIRRGSVDLDPIEEDSALKPDVDPEVVDLFDQLAKGAQVQEIASEQGIPPANLSSRLRQARKKLSANDNAHAVAILLGRGVLS